MNSFHLATEKFDFASRYCPCDRPDRHCCGAAAAKGGMDTVFSKSPTFHPAAPSIPTERIAMKQIAVLTGSCLLAAFMALPAFAASGADVSAAVRAFADAFHKGDMKAVKEMHISTPTIIDEMAPHYWSGPGAFDSWAVDLGKFETAQGISAGQVTIGMPVTQVVSGDHAYVVAPSSYSFQQKGAAMREAAQITIVMDKAAAGWKVASWSWAGRAPKPAKAH
jgi:ketosteroid isomerase-like protein